MILHVFFSCFLTAFDTSCLSNHGVHWWTLAVFFSRATHRYFEKRDKHRIYSSIHFLWKACDASVDVAFLLHCVCVSRNMMEEWFSFVRRRPSAIYNDNTKVLISTHAQWRTEWTRFIIVSPRLQTGCFLSNQSVN